MKPLRVPPIITLTTDFGLADHYVGTMKGVLLSRCPDARIVDISHDIPAFSIVCRRLRHRAGRSIFPAWHGPRRGRGSRRWNSTASLTGRGRQAVLDRSGQWRPVADFAAPRHGDDTGDHEPQPVAESCIALLFMDGMCSPPSRLLSPRGLRGLRMSGRSWSKSRFTRLGAGRNRTGPLAGQGSERGSFR